MWTNYGRQMRASCFRTSRTSTSNRVKIQLLMNLNEWGCFTVLRLFHLMCILCCFCFNLFCNVWVSVCVGVLVICVLVFTVCCIFLLCFLYCFFYVYLFLFALSVLVWGLLPPSDNSIAVDNNNNNNNNKCNRGKLYYTLYVMYTLLCSSVS